MRVDEHARVARGRIDERERGGRMVVDKTLAGNTGDERDGEHVCVGLAVEVLDAHERELRGARRRQLLVLAPQERERDLGDILDRARDVTRRPFAPNQRRLRSMRGSTASKRVPVLAREQRCPIRPGP